MSRRPTSVSARGRPRRKSGAGNVVGDVSSFLGRDQELHELRTALGRSRLVTLLGPGGIGKSRLARELAGRTEAVFPGGVWLVELAEVSNAATVPAAVARKVGIAQAGPEPVEDQISRVLGSTALLILDNCEHVIDASAELAATLLTRNRDLRILATSREPLEISGETIFTITALQVPETPQDVTLAEYARFPALQLFVDRVLSRDRTFRVTAENLPMIASVCASVGGMPLALELAAGRASRVTLWTLAEEIERQLGFESLLRDVPERHRSMRAALAASYEPLASEERALWKRLSIFRGGATASAAQELCARGGMGEDDFFHGLDGLIERSIVSLDSSTPEGRYRMLEPIRLFGLEQAAQDQEEHGLRRAHLEWCATLVPADAWLDGSEQVRWMQTVQAEHSNIAAALDYSLLENEITAGLDLFGATFFFWLLSGWAREQRHYAEALLKASEGSSRRRTMALYAAGLATWYTWEVAQTWFEEMLAAAKRDPRSRGLALFGLGFCAIVAESYDRAISLLQEACELLEATQSHVPLAYARYLLGQGHALGRHDYAAARGIAERNLTLVVRGDVWNRANTHAQLGVLDWRAGAFEDAENHLVEAFELQTELGNRFGVAASLEFLAWVAASENQPERAAQLLGYANRLFERIGMSLFPGFAGDRQEVIEVIRRDLGPVRYRELSDAGAQLQPAEVGNLVRRTTAASDDRANAPTLTVRELEVAELIARGATNHQISLELLIAHETVKSHVRSILRKLDFDSRVQIAGWYSTRHDGTSDA